MVRPADTSTERLLPFSRDPQLGRRFMVLDEPLQGNLRFGILLEILDKLAEDTALDYIRRSTPAARAVTAAIDRIVLRRPVDVSSDLLLRARINFVGRTSMEVGIRVDQPEHDGRHFASCYFTMVTRVGSGDAASSVAVSPLQYEDDLEKRRAAKALERREAYKREQVVAVEPPTRDEFELLARLHAAQEERGFDGRLASSLVTEGWERTYPDQENVPKKIFGGYIVRRAYELASINAEEIAPDRPIIVAVNRINFLQPVRMGDKLHFISRVIHTGRTSICVEVSIERISRDRTVRALSNNCIFTFVNVDGNLTPLPVPPVHPTTYAEDARYLQGHRHHQTYKARFATDEE
jgi:acyl-coenzyme A thioesterase 9